MLLFQCALTLSTCYLPIIAPSPLSPFLSEDWAAFCSQGPETQAVSAGNIFHSQGPTEALAATWYWSFQRLVLLGKYGSLWTCPLCRSGAGGGKRWVQVTKTIEWHSMMVCMSACSCHKELWQGFSINTFIGEIYILSLLSIWSGILNTWVMSLANANNRVFPWLGHLKGSLLLLPGKHLTAPSLIQSEKISVEISRGVFVVLGSVMLLLNSR